MTPRSIWRGIQRRIRYREVTGYVGLTPETTEALARDYPGIEWWRIDETGEAPVAPSRICHPPGDALSNRLPFTSHYEAVVLHLRNADFYFADSHFFDPGHRRLYEPNMPESMGEGQVTRRRPRHLDGPVAYLSNGVQNHYGHWLQYALPLLRAYRQSPWQGDIAYYYLGQQEPCGFVRDSLQAIGIPPQQMVWGSVTADRLLYAVPDRYARGRENRFLDAGSFHFTRESLLNAYRDAVPPAGTPRRLYLRRGKVTWRHVREEDRLSERLATYGFAPLDMDGRTLAEQIAIFQQAEAIVAPHGSALTNLFFIRPECPVIEILPARYAENSAFAFAAHVGAPYGYCRGRPLSCDVEPCYEDILPDLDKIEWLLREMSITRP